MNTDAWDIAVGAAIICCLADLSESERHAVVGRHIRGLTHAEIAAERRTTRQAVNSAEHRGRAWATRPVVRRHAARRHPAARA